MIIGILNSTHLVAVTPWVVFVTDVLVWVLDSLLERRHVLPMPPMLGPQVIGIDASEDHAGDDDAGRFRISMSSSSIEYNRNS